MAMVNMTTVGASDTADQALYVCRHSQGSHPRSIFYGENSLDFSFPLLLLNAVLIILLIRSLHFLLKPLKQPHIVSKILGGIIIGPSVLDRNRTFAEKVFPDNATYVFKHIGLIGFIYFLFLSGAKMDIATMARIGKKQLYIGLISVLVPFVTVMSIMVATRKSLAEELARVPAMGGIASAFAITTFPVLYQNIKELNLLSSEVGKLAMSSVMVGDCAGVVCMVLIEAARFESIAALWVFISFVGIVAVIGGIQQAMVFFLFQWK